MMKKTSYIFATLLLLFSLTASAISAAAVDRFYVEDVNLERGKTATVDFLLDNTTAFYGFQADVLLPDGLTMTSVALTSRAASSSFDLITNTVTHSDGRKYLRMGTFSTDHSPISGNSGALVRMTVDVASDFAGGELKITDILFINNENQDVTLADCTANIGIGVSSITLDKTTLRLTEGESETLTANITPEDATDPSVTWTSSDAAVATVDANGNVTAIKAGSATITATTANDKTASCSVTVNAPEPEVIEVTAITLDKTVLSLTEGESETLTANITPANATDPSVTWT